MKIALELDESASGALSELERLTGMSLSGIFSFALSLMLWVVRQGIAGRIVASVDESQHSYRELEVTALRRKQTRAA